MSAGPRSLPDHPSLRYLKIEAKRRLAAGEFAALHDAQTAIAGEHGLPSWAALKQACAGSQRESHALAHLTWLISRFRDAGEPGWAAPGDAEMRQHFDDGLLAAVPAGSLSAQIIKVAADLRAELVVLSQAPLQAVVQLAGMRYIATADARPPHRLTGLRGFPLGERITDPRAAAPPARVLGAVPAGMTEIADRAVAELGLPALVLAGGEPGQPPWVVAKGHADLDRAEVLDPGHRFPRPASPPWSPRPPSCGSSPGAGCAWTTRPTTTCARFALPTTRSRSGSCSATPAGSTTQPSSTPTACPTWRPSWAR
jgi:hypothetical protein